MNGVIVYSAKRTAAAEPGGCWQELMCAPTSQCVYVCVCASASVCVCVNGNPMDPHDLSFILHE